MSHHSHVIIRIYFLSSCMHATMTSSLRRASLASINTIAKCCIAKDIDVCPCASTSCCATSSAQPAVNSTETGTVQPSDYRLQYRVFLNHQTACLLVYKQHPADRSMHADLSVLKPQAYTAVTLMHRSTVTVVTSQ
jgi:hypothetical protein